MCEDCRGEVRLGTALAVSLCMTLSHVRTNRSVFVACSVLAVLGLASHASAQPRAAELRFQFFSPSYRWSPAIGGATEYNLQGRRSLYFSPGLGGRYFPRHGSHGALLQIDYRFDSQTDDPWCLFGIPDPCPSSEVEYATLHAGYAYRHTVPSPRGPRKRFWAFTPHLSLATGWAKNEPAAFGIPARSPVIGARVGFDIDLHFGRWFMGWSFRYEALAQTRGPVGVSHFFGWNAIPIFQMGIDLGKKSPQAHTPDGYPTQ